MKNYLEKFIIGAIKALKLLKGLLKNIFNYEFILLIYFIEKLPKFLKLELAKLSKFVCRDVYQYIDSQEKSCYDPKNKIVYFFSLTPHAREGYFANHAKNSGYSVVLFSIGKLREGDKHLYYKYFSIKNLLVLQLISWYLRNDIQHFFGLNGSVLYSLTRLKLNPIVVDIYDTCKGQDNCSQFQKKLEHYVLKNSDVITHRDLRIKHLYGSINRELSHDIFIPDLPRRFLIKNKGKICRDSEIHVVSTGWIDGKGNNILRTVERLCMAKIHVHILFNPLQHNNSPWALKYSELERASNYFHIEQPVFGDEYLEKISNYDFGLSVHDESAFGTDKWDYSKLYLESCGSSRVNDYISAGLGVIISPVFQFQLEMIKLVSGDFVVADDSFYNSPREKLVYSRARHKQRGNSYLSDEESRSQSQKIGELYNSIRV